MSYEQYGIPRELVERVKKKLKNPSLSEQIKQLVEGLTRADLQNRIKVKRLVGEGAKILTIPLSASQRDNIVNFVIAQKIDPNNKFHLIRLWGMFR